MNEALDIDLLPDERVIWRGAADQGQIARDRPDWTNKRTAFGASAVCLLAIVPLAFFSQHLPLALHVALGIVLGVALLVLIIGLALVFFGESSPTADRYVLTNKRLVLSGDLTVPKETLLAGASIYKVEIRRNGQFNDVGVYYQDPDEVRGCCFLRALPDAETVEAHLLKTFKSERGSP